MQLLGEPARLDGFFKEGLGQLRGAVRAGQGGHAHLQHGVGILVHDDEHQVVHGRAAVLRLRGVEQCLHSDLPGAAAHGQAFEALAEQLVTQGVARELRHGEREQRFPAHAALRVQHGQAVGPARRGEDALRGLQALVHQAQVVRIRRAVHAIRAAAADARPAVGQRAAQAAGKRRDAGALLPVQIAVAHDLQQYAVGQYGAVVQQRQPRVLRKGLDG